ncbi:MAG: hypothetical protein ACOCZV_00530 [Nanoarchaeota archaeon]
MDKKVENRMLDHQRGRTTAQSKGVKSILQKSKTELEKDIGY